MLHIYQTFGCLNCQTFACCNCLKFQALIQTYISAIKAKCVEFDINGFSWAHHKVGLMVRSCSRTSTFNPPTKQVLSPLTLTQPINHVATIPQGSIYRALFLLAFHGFFRISNLLPTSQAAFQPLRDLVSSGAVVPLWLLV